jgi:hypothetical protein
MNSFKKQVVLAVWELLDPTSQNRVDLGVMVSKYDGRRHPEVKQGRATPREVDAEFSSSARLHHSAYCPTSQFLSKDEFIDLYAHFAAVYPDDRLFELTLTACWGLPDSRLHRDARDGAGPASKGTGLWAEQMHGSRAEAPEEQSKPDLYDRRQASSAAKPAGSSSLFAQGVYNRR